MCARMGQLCLPGHKALPPVNKDHKATDPLVHKDNTATDRPDRKVTDLRVRSRADNTATDRRAHKGSMAIDRPDRKVTGLHVHSKAGNTATELLVRKVNTVTDSSGRKAEQAVGLGLRVVAARVERAMIRQPNPLQRRTNPLANSIWKHSVSIEKIVPFKIRKAPETHARADLIIARQQGLCRELNPNHLFR